jgi:uncharacterized 2Fe-2S/4Fe-4S cluster protein (DUF4445 family)
MVVVRFEAEGLAADVPVGTTLHEAAAEAGVALSAPCGGLGRCGSCRVRVSGDVRSPGAHELETLGLAARSGVRLACLARVEGPGEVVFSRDAPAASAGIPTGSPSARLAPNRSGAVPGEQRLGAAVDIGTTTIGVRLHALDDGALLAELEVTNPQVDLGADVLTRISRSMAGDADALRAAVTSQVERSIAALVSEAGAPGRLERIAVVGNPTMAHLFLGLDASAIASARGGGGVLAPPDVDAARAGMPSFAGAVVTVGPAASAFVGADAIAGLVATAIAERERPALLVDLGTNGEIVLAAGGRLFAASAAAGPAFEGVGLTSGMRAETGAIERVWLDDAGLHFETVGGAEPHGLCGSGFVDLVAVLLGSGVILADGLMPPGTSAAGTVSDSSDGTFLRLAGDVALSQRDVRILQLGKAAVAVAIDVLLDDAGIGADDVGEVIIAGGFGTHLRPASLARIGVIPARWASLVTLGGNTALAGASALLLSDTARTEARRLAGAIASVKLAERDDFRDRFVAALAFDSRP